MKFALTFVAGMLALAFVSASVAVAAEREREREGPAPTRLVLKGAIKSVDLEAKSFVLTSAKEGGEAVETTFLTGGETAILVNGKTVALADLKAGAKASVTYVKNGEKLTATKVAVTTAAKPADPGADRVPE